MEQGATGGFGALVLHHLANSGGLEKGRAIRTMTLPDAFIDQGSPAQMYEWAGMTATDIARTIRRALGRESSVSVARPAMRLV